MMGKGLLLTHAGLFLTIAKSSFRRRFAALVKIWIIAVMLIAGFVHTPQTVSADAVVAEIDKYEPRAAAVNPITNEIYVISYAGKENFKIIDGVTNQSKLSWQLSGMPLDVAVNPKTNKIYVTSYLGGISDNDIVMVIDRNNQQTRNIWTGKYPIAVAVNPVLNKIYVINKESKSLSIIDGETNEVTSTVDLGSMPRAIAVNPQTNKVYVTCSGNVVKIIDGETGKLSKSVSVGDYPESIAIDHAANQVYIAHANAGGVSVINGDTDILKNTIPFNDYLVGIAVNPITHKIYAIGLSNRLALIIDGKNQTIEKSVPVQSKPKNVVVNPVINKIYVTANDGVTVIEGDTNNSLGTLAVDIGEGDAPLVVNPVTNKIYAGSKNKNNVSVIDGTRTDISRIGTGNNPRFVAINPFTQKAYVTNAGSREVTIVDLKSKELNIVKNLNVGEGSIAAAVNPLTNRIYVVHDSAPSFVTVIDGTDDTIVTTVPVGGSPSAIAVNPITNQIYVANNQSSSVTVIDGASNNKSTVPVGSGPVHVAIHPLTNKVYVTNSQDGTVSILNGATKKVTATVPVGTNPKMAAVNEKTNQIYVANSGSNNVTIIDGASNATSTVPAGNQPYAIAVNKKTNKVYVSNFLGRTITVIDGASLSTAQLLTLDDDYPQKLAVDEGNDKIYVAALNSITVLDGVRNTWTKLASAVNATAIAVNPVTNQVYATATTNQLMAIHQRETASPLPVKIDAFPNNRLADGTASVRFTPKNNYAPIQGRILDVYYQLDSSQGAWKKATPSGQENWEGSLDGLTPGMHVLFAMATDGQEAKMGSGVGGAYPFYVAPQAAAPTASKPSGEMESGTTVSLSASTAGASIYYTTDGSTPTPGSSLLYHEPIPVTRNMTVKAIAVKAGMADSDVMTETYTIPVTAPSAPSAPEKLTSATGDREITLSWSTVANADSYAVYKYEGTSAPANPDDWVLIQENITVNTYTVTGLMNYMSYAFAVKAFNTKGASDFSDEVIAIPAADPVSSVPSAPLKVIAEAGDGQAKVSFHAPENDGGSPILSYTVTGWVNGTATPITKSGDSSPIIVTGLTNGTTYTFTVEATNKIGNSVPSAPSNPVTPKAKQPDPDTEEPQWPIGSELTVSDITQTSVKLSWPTATDNVGVTGFRIYVNGTEHETVGGGVNGTTVTSLAADTTYMFKVIAYDAAGNESEALTISAKTLPEPSEPDTEAPQWPDDSELTVSDVTQTSVKLSWQGATDNVRVTGYRIYVDEVEYKTAGGNENAIIVTGLTAETSYTFKVTAHDEAGNESAALSVSAKTLPQPTEPDNEAPQWPDDSELTVSDVTQTSVKLSWPSATDNVRVTGYRIYVDDVEYKTVGGSENAIIVTGLTAETSYTFKVTAHDEAGNESAALSALAKTLPQPTEPDTEAPQWPDDSELTVSDVTQTSVKLSWPSATDNVRVTGYRIYVDDVEYKTAGGNENAIIVTGLTAETSYTFKVTAHDEAGNESAALSVSAKTLPQPTEPDTEAPQWPDDSELTVSDVTQTSVKLSWPSAIDNVGVTGYRIYVDDFEYKTAGGSENTITVTGLTAETSYMFKVTAHDEAGNESTAMTTSAKTLSEPSEPDTEVPQWPDDSELTVSDVTQTSVKLSWPSAIDNVGVTGYRIYVDDFEYKTADGNENALIVNDLTAETSYTFKVTAYDEAGNESAGLTTSAKTLPQPTEPDTEAPQWPDDSELTVSDITQTSVKLLWPSATDNVAVIAYRIYVNGTEREKVVGNVHAITIDGLTANTSYTFKVTAFDAAGNVSDALTASANTMPQPTESDTEAPKWADGSKLTVSDIAQTSMKLSWPIATDNVGVTGYRIYVDGKERTTVSGNVYLTTITGLTANTNYTLRVTAFDAEGNESAALTASAKTLPQPSIPDTEAPQWPSGSQLTVSGITKNSVKLSWPTATDNVGVTGYRIYVDDKERMTVSGKVYATTVDSLSGNTTYMFKVTAYDAEGNESAPLSKQVTTARSSSGGGGSGGSGSAGGRALSSNADLEELRVWDKDKKLELSPSFAAGTTSYTARTEAEQVEIAAKSAHSGAKVMLKEKVITDRTKVHLEEGDNTFVLTVQAENGTKKKYTLTIYRETPKPSEPVIEFTDIAGHWAESNIKRAAEKGIASGYPDGTFKPNHSVTRAEFTVMLTGALQLEEMGAPLTFTDNDQIGAWAKQAIAQAVQAGIIDGYGDGSFRPNAQITRAEMAGMIARAMKLPLKTKMKTGFTDDEAIPEWAKGAVEAIRGLGITSGREENKFVPDDMATRAEATMMLLRMLEHK
ncbi:fibronectin type III domain-containing protein [Paenibacillus elgii]|uniref:fibronectin type III domain-containing protein n=1 Tax=Paenibacillus elgii TaxID=189691 RepID=UPI0013D6B0BE|nr:fibronectin type III domain-containing protein [Paenibacillus elgii]